ncbi:hypothetical protein R1A27_17000 [Methylobacterium sp. NMS12]|uniref:hypothetical protein n=1 Tax=Methylobacterium sp. NMS12 TaxID=3079766 RepID=UPI003F884955
MQRIDHLDVEVFVDPQFCMRRRAGLASGLRSAAELAQECIERFAEMRLKHLKLRPADRHRARKIVNDTIRIVAILAPKRSLAPPHLRRNLLNERTIDLQLFRSPGGSVWPLMLGASYRARLF